jgi:hypothetical protein
LCLPQRFWWSRGIASERNQRNGKEQKCASGEVSDEFHYLFNCQFVADKAKQEFIFKKYYQTPSKSNKMSSINEC